MKNIKVTVFGCNIAQVKQKILLAADINMHSPETNVLHKIYDEQTMAAKLRRLVELGHKALFQHDVISVFISGCSRRFMAQITRHQNDVHYSISSLQYTKHRSRPDEMYDGLLTEKERETVDELDRIYNRLCEDYTTDIAGYFKLQRSRENMLITATLYEWVYMLRVRLCKRNTPETQHIMWLIYDKLHEMLPEVFNLVFVGPGCCRRGCEEGRMSCGDPIKKEASCQR